MKVTKNLNSVVRGAEYLSLGISVVVAVILGFVIGFYLKKWTGISLFFYVFIAFGICAAFLNIYKVYKRQLAEYKEIENDPKYRYFQEDEEDDEWSQDSSKII